MSKEKEKKDFGTGTCEYRNCNLPEKKFTKTREDQRFCCDRHRVAEWNLQNPRLKKNREDAKRQEPLPLGLMEKAKSATGTEEPEVFRPKVSRKRSFHYTDIAGTGKRVFILRKTLELMMKSDPTTFDLNAYTGSTRASSDVSELRRQGFDSECIPCGKSEEGLKVSRFRLTESGREKAVEFFRRVS